MDKSFQRGQRQRAVGQFYLEPVWQHPTSQVWRPCSINLPGDGQPWDPTRLKWPTLASSQVVRLSFTITAAQLSKRKFFHFTPSFLYHLSIIAESIRPVMSDKLVLVSLMP